LIYVEDIITTASIPVAIDDLLQQLWLAFTVKDLGGLYFFLGVEVVSLKSGILLSRCRFIGLTQAQHMLESKPISPSMSAPYQRLPEIPCRTLRFTVAHWDLCNISHSRDLTWGLL
jgi:hypothetical protein